ncbi:MAG: response regulator transcription factor [Myxococcota bacterium]
MEARAFDPIAVVEAAYTFDVDEETWLSGVAERARPFFPPEGCVSGTIMDLGDDFHVISAISDDPDHQNSNRVHAFFELADELPELFDQLYSGTSLIAISDLLGASPRDHPAFAHMQSVACRDFAGVVVCEPSGCVIQLGAELPSVSPTSENDRRIWNCLTSHIGAGFRLMRSVSDASLDSADAVLSPNGELEHSNHDVTEKDLWRRALREAAFNLERARSSLRHRRPYEALQLWKGLVRGRYSLVETFDTDGKRFYVARRNDPKVDSPKPLSQRERQVAAYVGLGLDNRCIGYTLGLSESTIATYVSRAIRKLGLKSRSDLIQLVRHAGPRDHDDDL